MKGYISIQIKQSDLPKLIERVPEAFTVEDPLISRKEAAQRLGISPKTLDRITESGSIKHYRVGKRNRYKNQDLENYLNPGKEC